MKLNRKWLLVTALVLSIALATGGTLAYLTDTDSDVNVMTIGNVKIDQLEKDENGNNFTQKQPLYPAYYPNDEISWGDELIGEIEKYVSVENKGTSNAYARTWVAFEADDSMIMKKWASGVAPVYKCNAPIAAEIDGEMLVQEYAIYCYTYPTELKPDETYSVLEEIAMDKRAGNDYVESFGDTYDVLVFTQAVQTANLTQLQVEGALNEAFGSNHPWMEGKEGELNNATLKEAIDALSDKTYGKLTLTKDVTWVTGAEIGSTPMVEEGKALKNLVIEGNGKTLTATGDGVGALRAANGGTITFQNMTIKDESVSYVENNWEYGYLEFGGKLVFKNVHFENAVMFENRADVTFINCTFNSHKDSEYGAWISDGSASFTNCTFTGPRGLKMHEEYGSKVDSVVVDNCAFVNLTKKPGVAIGTVDADTDVTIKNSRFIGCQPGDQSKYIYETDTDVTTFNFVEQNNEVVNEGVVKGADKAALLNAINEVDVGGTVYLTEDTTIAGYDAAKKLVIEKNVTLDLNGQTLTTESGWGGIDLKGGASIINGTINHTGNTAAIKAFQVGRIENVTINVTETAGKTKGGIVVQNGDSSIGSIENVTINGPTNGIECFHSTKDPAIGSMKNVKINATANGIFLNGAGKLGTISDCEIHGGNIGINAYLANLWHIGLDIRNSKISGGTTGIDIWDEGATNTGSTVTFNYDDKTVFSGSRENIKVTLQEEISCTINGEQKTTPCDLRITETK